MSLGRVFLNQWLDKSKSLDLFNEIKLVSDVSFDCYDKIPDPEENVCELS